MSDRARARADGELTIGVNASLIAGGQMRDGLRLPRERRVHKDSFFDFVEQISNARSDIEVRSVLRTVATGCGFDHFIISGLPPRGVNVLPFVMAEDWPMEWHERYFGLDYTQFDPVAKFCFRTTDPFDWEQAPVADGDSRGQRVMDEATEFGLHSGYCVPVHTADGAQGRVSFGGGHDVLDPSDKVGLHMVSVYAHGRLRSFRRSNRIRPDRRLTAREAEVLQWAAQGKTSDDIADMLGISTSTVTAHVTSAQRKLGTLNRVHTVAEAIRYNLISL